MTCQRFYFPPHPPSGLKIRREDLPDAESTGRYVAQLKYNGTHVVVYVGNGDVEIKERRDKVPVLYKLTDDMRACFLAQFPKGEWVFAGELLHHKAKNQVTGEQAVKNTIVLFDLLYQGRYLIGVPVVERLDMLRRACGDPAVKEPKERALEVTSHGESHIWLAETFAKDFQEHFEEFWHVNKQTGVDRYPEIEGLVLRQKDGMLLSGDRLQDVTWLVRCRKEKPKVYRF